MHEETLCLQIVDSVVKLHAQNVVHFDLKLQNIYLDPYPGTDEAELWAPSTPQPAFRVVIGDFGQSQAFPPGSNCCTLKSLGTDFMKSPEMLHNGQHPMLHRQRENFDRRRHKGAGPPSDVWSLACVLYELVFGEMLFFDHDYMRFLQRVSFGAGPVLPSRALGKLARAPVIAQLVDLMTQRSQEARIDLFKVQVKLKQLQQCSSSVGLLSSALPRYVSPSQLHPPDQTVVCSSGTRIWSSICDALSVWSSLRLQPCVASNVEQSTGVVLDVLQRSCVVTLSTDVLFCPSKPFVGFESISALEVQCLVIVGEAEGTRSLLKLNRWLEVASDLRINCVFFKTAKLSVSALMNFCADAPADSRVMVLFDPESWRPAAVLSLCLLMFRDVPCAMGLVRLQRCSAHGKLIQEDLEFLEEFSEACSTAFAFP